MIQILSIMNKHKTYKNVLFQLFNHKILQMVESYYILTVKHLHSFLFLILKKALSNDNAFFTFC